MNIYSTEGGVESIESGYKTAKDGKNYPFVGIDFKNGNSVKFYGKNVEEVEAIVSKIMEALNTLVLLADGDPEYPKEEK